MFDELARAHSQLRCARGGFTGAGMSEDTPADTPPDHLSVNPRSPHFDAEKLQRGVGIRFKDRVRTDIEEYCISEGWVRLAVGKAVDRKGNALTVKLQGPVEPYLQDGSAEG